MPTLYVTDLDGTLLGPDGRPTAATVSTVNRLVGERGLQLTYATARSFRSASTATAGLHLRLPVAVYGGAFLVDPGSGDLISSRIFDDAVTTDLLRLCRDHRTPPLVYTLTGRTEQVSWVAPEVTPGISSYVADREPDPRFAPVTSWSELPTRGCFYLSVIGSRAAVEPFAAAVAAGHGEAVTLNVQDDTYHREQTWCEVTPLGADKATAALDLRAAAGADRLVVFGDNVNDLRMFAVADHALAVADARPEVRAAADEVIGRSDDDAVARWLLDTDALGGLPG